MLSSVAPTTYVFGNPYFVSVWSPRIACALCVIERGRARSRRWQHFCAGVRTELFWLMIYCANPRPNPGSQSGSRSRRVLGWRAPRNMGQNNLMTAIAVRLLTYPCMCKMGSLIFSAMSRLKIVSTVRASFPSMPYTKRENGEIVFHCSWQCLPCLSFFSFYHQSRSF